MKSIISYSLLAILLLLAPVAGAESLQRPAGIVILTLDGAVAETNADGGRADFDLAMLEALERHSLAIPTPWTEGIQHFEGVRLADLLDAVGARGMAIDAVSLDNYKSTLELAEMQDSGAVLAFEQNGAPMTVRNKGPLRIVFSQKKYQHSEHLHKWVWQLRRLHVR